MNYLKAQAVKLLRWSEKYTKTDMVYLAKGGSWLGIAQVVGSLASLATSIAFANLLPPETYGEYRYVISVFNLLTIPTLTGLATSLTKSVAQGYDASIFKALKTRLIGGLIGTIIGSGISVYYLFQNQYSLAISLLTVSLVIPIFYAAELFVPFLYAKKLFKQSTAYSFFIVFLSTLSLITALFLTDNVPILLASYFVPYTTLRTLFLILTIKKYAVRKETDKETISYGIHTSVMDAVNTVAENLDKLLLWHLIGAVEVAAYALAVAPVKHFSALIGKIRDLIFPKLAEKDILYIKKIAYTKMLQLFIVVVAVVGAYIIAAPFLFAIIFPQYISSVGYSQIFALTFLFYPQIVMTTTFSAHAKIKEKYIISLTGSIGKIILLVIFVPLYGIAGVLASYLAMKAITFLIALILFRRLQ